jgi:hypothetical protein
MQSQSAREILTFPSYPLPELCRKLKLLIVTLEEINVNAMVMLLK